MSEERVPSLAGHFEIFRAERTTNTLLGVWSWVDRIVQEPRPVVVPQVVIRIIRANTD